MNDQPQPIIAIWDMEEKKFFKTWRGKWLWNAVGHAKNSWNTAMGYYYTREHGKFNDQSRYVIKDMSVIPTDRLTELHEIEAAYVGLCK